MHALILIFHGLTLILFDIYMVVSCLFCMAALLLWFTQRSSWAKARKLTWELYSDHKGTDKKYHPFLGNIINESVLCPVCEGYVLVSCWKEHLLYRHTDYPHVVGPFSESLQEAKRRLAKQSKSAKDAA